MVGMPTGDGIPVRMRRKSARMLANGTVYAKAPTLGKGLRLRSDQDDASGELFTTKPSSWKSGRDATRCAGGQWKGGWQMWMDGGWME